jgi:hypothetical protein
MNKNVIFLLLTFWIVLLCTAWTLAVQEFFHKNYIRRGIIRHLQITEISCIKRNFQNIRLKQHFFENNVLIIYMI